MLTISSSVSTVNSASALRGKTGASYSSCVLIQPVVKTHVRIIVFIASLRLYFSDFPIIVFQYFINFQLLIKATDVKSQGWNLLGNIYSPSNVYLKINLFITTVDFGKLLYWFSTHSFVLLCKFLSLRVDITSDTLSQAPF